MPRSGGGIYLRTFPSGKQLWYCRFRWQGRDVRRGGFESKEEARRILRTTLSDLERGELQLKPAHHETIAGLLERYRAIVKHHKNYPKTEAYYRFWTDRLGKLSLKQLTPHHIEQAQQILLEGRSPSTVNHYTSWFRAVLSREVRLGHLLANPCSRVRQFKESKGRLRYLSLEEEARLLTAIGPIHAPWVRLAILTGLRQDEQFSLRWDQIDLERGMIALPETKSGVVQYPLLNRQAQAILARMKKHATSQWVLPSQKTTTPISAKNFYRRIYVPALKQAGLRIKHEDPGQKVDWHTLRHTFASRLAMQGVPLGTIAALLRHSGTSLVKRYAHLSPAYLAGAIEEVARYGNDTRPTLKRESAS